MSHESFYIIGILAEASDNLSQMSFGNPQFDHDGRRSGGFIILIDQQAQLQRATWVRLSRNQPYRSGWG